VTALRHATATPRHRHRHATPRHAIATATPRHRHATATQPPRHATATATPRHATPRHATTRHATATATSPVSHQYLTSISPVSHRILHVEHHRLWNHEKKGSIAQLLDHHGIVAEILALRLHLSMHRWCVDITNLAMHHCLLDRLCNYAFPSASPSAVILAVKESMSAMTVPRGLFTSAVPSALSAMARRAALIQSGQFETVEAWEIL
jgi:hypothetical protein